MKKERAKYYIVTYCKHIHTRVHIKALSKEEAIDLAMNTSGGLVDEKSIDCFQILKKDYEKHFS